ncbi:DUF4381 domain-containing protein [Thermochromatium tepidum]|uniref:DUF4381 family protein n=1 Tax=Thermochromatium tepidum ATCC 43061 TaxID=316276 RepID=A0A6I6EDS0_THETI|nr:DUF4381 domain-containing protein [Thermochromatium tepidum]QGU33119.1 DUF4381 family protein [Thermochromatium tepidum ATCC 43061]
MTTDPLADLRDWHLPEPVSWWPPAPGWWLVAVVLIALVLVVRPWWRRRSRASVQRAARRELARLGRELAVHGDRRRYLAELSHLLRRLALARYPRAQVAGLVGEDWLAFLDATGGAGAFSKGVGRVLVESAHRPADQIDLEVEPLAELVERWIAVGAAVDEKR